MSDFQRDSNPKDSKEPSGHFSRRTQESHKDRNRLDRDRSPPRDSRERHERRDFDRGGRRDYDRRGEYSHKKYEDLNPSRKSSFEDDRHWRTGERDRRSFFTIVIE